MQPITLFRSIALALSLGVVGISAHAAAEVSTPTTAAAQMQHIRNATSKISYAGKVFLIDPMLAKRAPIRALKVRFAVIWPIRSSSFPCRRRMC